ncbi:transcriptional regulator domain-containing protein [Caulobacter hibisci]|uniref:transcriptional regulator domain-containing protein n=1 Tax=Caulobacter hibisci TaxID=2035993 RepID=UPI001E5EC9BD|nr:DUF6499 domain-containing protein [Caulobacter hibisci]
MSPDASRWRSAQAYDYVDELSAADLAWEYLRRNPDYQSDFQAPRQASGQSDWPARWGLRFPRRSFA